MVSEAVDLEKATVRHDDGRQPKHPAGNGEQDEDGDEDDEDLTSVASSTAEYECDNNNSQTLTLADVDNQDRSPCFQNIEVTNSSDVHFGNKTYYQGPVTIKQILYTNPNGNDDPNSERDATNGKLPISDGVDNNGYLADGSLGGNFVLKNGNPNIANNTNGINSNNTATSNNWTGKSRGKQWLQNRTGKELVIGTAILICIVVSIIGITVILITKYLQDQDLHGTSPKEEDTNNPNNYPNGFVTRRQWGAREEKAGVDVLNVPVPYVVIHHTATEGCTTISDCMVQARFIQDFHMDSNGWSDVGYNFMVAGDDGLVYEARGWTKLGAHVKSYNHVSIGIAFIGLFEDVLPSNASLLAAKKLIEIGVEGNYIRKDYKLFGMRQLSKFSSPGQKLYELIKTWPHWSSKL